MLAGSYLKQKVDKKEVKGFFNWLGVTKSGFDWFLMHKLTCSKSIILDDISSDRVEFDLPKAIQDLAAFGERSKESYLKFSKNIQI